MNGSQCAGSQGGTEYMQGRRVRAAAERWRSKCVVPGAVDRGHHRPFRSRRARTGQQVQYPHYSRGAFECQARGEEGRACAARLHKQGAILFSGRGKVTREPTPFRF